MRRQPEIRPGQIDRRRKKVFARGRRGWGAREAIEHVVLLFFLPDQTKHGRHMGMWTGVCAMVIILSPVMYVFWLVIPLDGIDLHHCPLLTQIRVVGYVKFFCA